MAKLYTIPFGVLVEECQKHLFCSCCPLNRDNPLSYSVEENDFIHCLLQAILDDEEAFVFLDEEVDITYYTDVNYKEVKKIGSNEGHSRTSEREE